MNMESLLCNEVLFMMSSHKDGDDGVDMHAPFLLYQTEAEFEEAFGVILEKEESYMPQPDHVNHVNSSPSIHKARMKAVRWLVQRRFGLSIGTVFNAANYLDRFISINRCQGWDVWMFELLSIACLSVASKFNAISSPPLLEFQEGLEHCFEWRVIQRMELSLLKAVGWRLGPTTPYSYVEMLDWSLRSMNGSLSRDLIGRITHLLLNALLDPKFLEFGPFVVAMSAITAIFELLLPTTKIQAAGLLHSYYSFISPEHEDMFSKCKQEMMNKHLMDKSSCLSLLLPLDSCSSSTYKGGCSPSSPVTVLTIDEQFNVSSSSITLKNSQVDHPNPENDKRRKRRRSDI